MGHNFWSLDLILHFCGQMPFGTIIQNNFTISHPFGMNPLHSPQEAWLVNLYSKSFKQACGILLLMEEILHHLGCIKPCK